MSKKQEIEKINVFSYLGYSGLPEGYTDDEPKNELWVQLLCIQNKINEIIDHLTNLEKESI